MKAAVCTKYGPPEVLKIADVKKPAPKNDEMLVEVKASAVTQSDIFIRGSDIPLRVMIPMRLMMGIFRPRRRVIGLVFSGVVRETGTKIKRFKPGDEVYGMTGFNLGAYAEYACMKETDSIRGCVGQKPRKLSFEEATAAVYGGCLGLQYLDESLIGPGRDVLVYGASGTSGTIAVQYMRSLGAKVTAICSGRHSALVKSLGADRVIDYTKNDTLDEGMKFSFILDAVGGRKTSKLKENCVKALADGGKYASIDDAPLELKTEMLEKLTGLFESGKIKPVLDRTYTLDRIAEAHRYVEQGHKTGGVAITVAG
jgi:NADPH:quinone reductase-like Zn-dependent oxidoreductase